MEAGVPSLFVALVQLQHPGDIARARPELACDLLARQEVVLEAAPLA